MQYRMNSNVGGVGDAGEIVEADPQLYAGLVEAGYMSPVEDDSQDTAQDTAQQNASQTSE